MSYFILNQLRCCRSRVNLNKRYGSAAAAVKPVRYYSDDNGTKDGNDEHAINGLKTRRHALGQAVILVQQGVEIQELPIIVRRYGQNEIVAFGSNKLPLGVAGLTHQANNENTVPTDQSTAHISSTPNSTNVVINPVTDCDTIIKLLEKCETGESILQMIASLPKHELEQDTLVFALEKILRIEPMQMLKSFEATNEQYQQLLNSFCRVCDTTILLNVLKQLQSMLFMNQSIEQICDEILMRNADGCLSVMEICEAVHRFVECQRFTGAEKFWAGLSDADKDINENNIKFVFEILPKLKVSRRMVVGILDKRIVEVFPLLRPNAVNDIMEAIKEGRIGCHTNDTLKAITRWLNVNIHAVNETHLEQIVHCLTALNYTDSDFESAIERYMKAKAMKIKSQTLVIEILKHVNTFRLLNSYILNGCSEFYIKEAANIDPGYLRDIVYPFGRLHFQPMNTSKFWETIETYLNINFNKISTAHIVDILLATVYLKLFPVNFIDRVFNRQFMHLLHSSTSMNELPMVREKLKLLDTALTLECSEYNGPLLPRQVGGNQVTIDNRIKRIINDNSDIIQLIAGDKTSYTTLQVPQQLPYCNLYTIDVLFHPPGFSLINYNKIKDRNVLVAALIHLPEYYDTSGTYLIGEQQMRIRHLRHIGLKVVSLQYTALSKLSMHRKELYEYIAEQMSQALPAIEPNK
ncbi:uncharacterized protein LOC129576327 [Sitodiplosis mosellana]|uniref:uncharacterized protein LOC129576327 n=1 Tax=Sitodiplosis mosellana TaxID=263140 RepID=UPI00244477D7|nr:uncharacterized protein LOC129576327 [Sitodiplosis mosellana]